MRLVKRILCVAFSGLLQLAVLGGFLVAAGSAAYADVVSDEARFVQRINADRASVGAPPVSVVPRLVDIARAWSRLLSERSTSVSECSLAHNQNLLEVLRPASKVAENVGCGDASADALHDAFMNSPSHRKNILDPSLDGVGVGVVMTGETMFVSVEFIRSVAVVTPSIAVVLPAPIPSPAAVPPVKSVPARVIPAPQRPAPKSKPVNGKTAATAVPRKLVPTKASPKKIANLPARAPSATPRIQSIVAKRGRVVALRAKPAGRLFRRAKPLVRSALSSRPEEKVVR